MNTGIILKARAQAWLGQLFERGPVVTHTIDALTRRVKKTEHGFSDIRETADEVVAGKTVEESIRLARRLYA